MLGLISQFQFEYHRPIGEDVLHSGLGSWSRPLATDFNKEAFDIGNFNVPQQSCTAWPMGRHVVVDEESGIVNSMLMTCEDRDDAEVLHVRRVVGVTFPCFSTRSATQNPLTPSKPRGSALTSFVMAKSQRVTPSVR